jgi:hypothetical protein
MNYEGPLVKFVLQFLGRQTSETFPDASSNPQLAPFHKTWAGGLLFRRRPCIMSEMGKWLDASKCFGWPGGMG